LINIDTSDLYFEKDHLLLASITSTGAVTGNRQNAELLERIRQRLRALPGVTYASYATAAPPHDHGWMDLPVVAGGSTRPRLADGTVVGPDYIHALGVPALIGRDISAGDLADGPAPAVINRKLAEELWPSRLLKRASWMLKRALIELN
jgi:hypothetical protein